MRRLIRRLCRRRDSSSMRSWRVDVRIDKRDYWWTIRRAGTVARLFELADLHIDHRPPSAGPEVEISFTVYSETGDGAVWLGEQLVEKRLDVAVLTSRARPTQAVAR